MIIITFATVQMIMFQWVNTLDYYGTEHDHTNIFIPMTDYAFYDSFITMWSLGLGDFSIKNYSDMGYDLPFMFFLLATFFTNIVFLNMMIAIMGDTFDKMTEKKERNGLRERTKLYADFMIYI